MIIRPVTLNDLPAVLALVPRLAQAGVPAGRDPDQVTARDASSIEHAIRHPADGEALLIALADDRKDVLGFIHVISVTDYYTQSRVGHISDVAIAATAEGQGVGRALMEAAESWARKQGYALMQLHVVVENARARRMYERLGYAAEWLKYVKRID